MVTDLEPLKQILAVDPETQSNSDHELPCECYFDFNRNAYWILNERKSWISVNETQLKRLLRSLGIISKCADTEHVSPLERCLLSIQGTRDIHYAAPLAGYHAGMHLMGEKRVLATESPRLIAPRKGQWKTLQALIDGLLWGDDIDQRAHFFGWLKVAVESLLARQPRPGQVLAICGPHDCGKSLLQNLLTVILGGRSAKPYQFMAGATQFNGDLFEAEHLMIEDDQSSTDIRARRSFGAQIKCMTVNATQRCHPKNRPGIALNPFWRISITINDQPECLMVLPPFDDSIEDKIILLRAFKRPMPMASNTTKERQNFWNQLVSELPAFVHFLIEWKIPDGLISPRFGVAHFHHPELLEALNALAPEAKLLQLIDLVLFDSPLSLPFDGTAAELEQRLIKAECGYEARKLLSWSSACGVYLSRLANGNPRIVSARDKNSRKWSIYPPGMIPECRPVTE